MVTGKFALQNGFYPSKYFASELWQARWNGMPSLVIDRVKRFGEIKVKNICLDVFIKTLSD
jgi:hypothetical protein